MADSHHETLRSLYRDTPREDVSQRPDNWGKDLDYIKWATAARTIADAAPDYEFTLIEVRQVEEGWIVWARMVLLGATRENVGYAPMEDNAVDCGVKDAVSDAFKRCACLFGVALDLYGKDNGDVSGARDKPPAVRRVNVKPTIESPALGSAPTAASQPRSTAQDPEPQTAQDPPALPLGTLKNEIAKMEQDLQRSKREGFQTPEQCAETRIRHLDSKFLTTHQDYEEISAYAEFLRSLSPPQTGGS
mgnify:CR=1 FL=1